MHRAIRYISRIRPRPLLPLLLALLLCLALAPGASAGTEATKVIPASGDTWVREGLATSQWSATFLRSGRSSELIHRSLVRFPQVSVDDLRDKNVLGATLYLYGTRSGACDRRVQAQRLTGPFGSSTVWANRPPAATTAEGSTTQGAGGPGCPAGWVGIPISKGTIDGWADGALANYGLVVRATNETDDLGWRQFGSLESSADPQLHVAYNTPPATPTLLDPAAGASGDCDPTLSASYADAEGGEGQVAFHVLDSAGNVVVGDWAASSGGKATWKVPRNADGSCKLEAGKAYTWRAIAHDGRDFSSAWSELRPYSVDGPTWKSDFETGDFSEWDWWGQGDPTYTGLSVVDPADQGFPRLSGRSGRFQVTDSDVSAGRIHSKLYKFFHTGSGDRVNWGRPNVSGTYRAWYYLPPDYAVRSGKWVTPFQFKDQYWYTEPGGSEHSDPVWFLAFKNASDYGVQASRPDAPVAIVQHWDDWKRGYPDYIYPGQRVPVPLGRWFEIRAEVYEGDRVEFYMDDKLVNVGQNSDYPVGNHHSLSFNWIFGIGNYTNSPSWLFSDQASYRRR